MVNIKKEEAHKKPEIDPEIKNALKELGFTEYYTNIYYTLLSEGEMDARALSQQAHVPYSRIYEVLNDMVRRQIITKLDGRPSLFVGNNPNKTFFNIKQTYQKELEENVQTCTQFLQSLYEPDSHVQEVTFQLLKGNRTAAQHMRNKLKNAVKTVKLQISNFDAVFQEIKDELKFLEVKGVKLYLLLEKKFETSEFLEDIKWAKTRFMSDLVNSYLVVDKDIALEAKMGHYEISEPEKEEWVIFQTQNITYVQYISEIFDANFSANESV